MPRANLFVVDTKRLDVFALRTRSCVDIRHILHIWTDDQSSLVAILYKIKLHVFFINCFQ